MTDPKDLELATLREELRAARAQLEILASTDPLTGAANRRVFLETAQAEVARSLRYRRPVALVLCDIDRFKAINDTHGHPCGDRIIVTAAGLLEHGRRTVDRVGRIGGEEFAVILPETDEPTAFAVAEKMRRAIESARLEWEGKKIDFTMSFGVGSFSGMDFDSIDAAEVLRQMVQQADNGLHRAKTSGRNRVS